MLKFYHIFWLKISLLVIDCDLPDCPTSLCGAEAIECTRVCENGIFGIDAECPAESEAKTDTCPEICFQLTQDNLYETLPKLYQIFKVSFELWPVTVTTETAWANLLRVGIGGQNEVYGDRNPAVFFLPGTTSLHIGSGISGDRNLTFDTDPIPLETWTSVVIEQKQGKFYKNQHVINDLHKMRLDK